MALIENLAGFFAGLAGGMGIGGGGILLLYLTAFTNTKQLSAQGINLVFFLATAPVALIGHIKNGFVKWKTALTSTVFGLPGVIIGFFIAQSIDKTLLRGAFALLLLFIGTRELIKK